jgi:hypothetical protein
MSKLKEHLLMWPALIILGGSLIALLYGINTALPHETKIDCRIAEISPDIPLAAKEECRKLQAK